MRAASLLVVTLLAPALLAATPRLLCATGTVTKDITHLKQSDPRGFDAERTKAEVNCTPTAIIQCLEWWARHGYPGLVPNANINQIYAAVKTLGEQARISRKGVGWPQIEEVINKWLQKHGNPALKVTAHNKDWSYAAVRDQFLPTAGNPNGQDVIWLGTQISQDKKGEDVEGGGHAMTMESLDTKTSVTIPGETQPGRKVGFADPDTGARKDFVMSSSGALYDPTTLKKVYKPAGFVTVCPS